MKDSLYHLMIKLVTKGPQKVSDCGDIEAINAALNLGFITVNPQGEVDWYYITSGGIQTTLAAYDKRPDPEQYIHGAIHIKHAERTDEGFSGQPLVVLGGALAWVYENLFGSKLTFSTRQSEFEYAVFDYLDLDGKTWLMQPGDWLIISEDHKHVLHQFVQIEDDE